MPKNHQPFKQLPQRLLTLGVPVVAALLFCLATGSYFTQKERFRLEERRTATTSEAVAHAKSLERHLEQAVAAPTILASMLAAGGRANLADQVAERLLQLNHAVSELLIVPERGALRSYGGRADSLRGAATRSTEIADELAARNVGLQVFGAPVITASREQLVISQTVHSMTVAGEPQFWGYVQAIVRLPDLADVGQLQELAQEGYDYRLMYSKPGYAAPLPILAQGAPDDNPVVRNVLLSNGDSLLLAVRPRGGWAPDPFMYAEILLGVIAGILLGIFLYVLLRQPDALRREVAQRTADLDAANRALRRNSALLDSIFEYLPVVLILKQVEDLRIVRVNAFTEAVLGRDRSTLVGRAAEDILPIDQAAELVAGDFRAITNRRAVDLPEMQLLAADGLRPMAVRTIPLYNEAGIAEYLLMVAEDMTERRELEKGIREQLHLFELFVDALPTPAYVRDSDGRYLMVNRAFERLFAVTRQALCGNDLPAGEGPLATVPADASGFEGELQVAEGRRKQVIVHQVAIDEPGGTSPPSRRQSIGVIVDITEHRRAEQRLAHLNRTHAVLSGISELIVRVRDPQTILERACEILVERGKFPLAWAFRIQAPGSPQVVASRGEDPGLTEAITGYLLACPQRCQDAAGNGDTRVTICNGDACRDNPAFALARQHQYRSMAIISIVSGDQRIGGLGVLSRETNVFMVRERQLLGELSETISHGLDAITQESRREEAEASLKLAAQVFANSSEGIIITDAGNRILMVNKAFSQVTGYTPAEVIGHNPRLLSSGSQDGGFYREMWQAIQRRGEWHGEVQNRRKNGEIYAEWLTISAVKDDAGNVTNYVAVFSDITSRKLINERLNFLANYDPLTALPNRVLFSDRLEQALASARARKRAVAVLFLDLDRFSLINETFGHTAGDDLLREIANRLMISVRHGDSVSRMGGDEFAVILGDLESPQEAATVAGKIMQEVARPLVYDGKELFTSASIGISVFPDDGLDAETLVKNANSAMYRAMQEGRNTYRYYHQEMNARSSERMSLESQLRYAMERGELELHYQPLIDARNGRIVGAEALLRWNRPGIGHVMPGTFIPLLEETGLIVPVGEWVLRTACRDNQAWRTRGFGDLFVAVNFSALQLHAPGIARRVGDTASELGFDPRHLEIELTESAVMRDAEQGIRVLHEIKEIGPRLSVDDFGTGYSSLSYLKRLPIDTLKIDRSFVIDAPEDAETKAIVQAIVAMGHSLGLKIIAEGVQREEQVAFLRQLRCDLLQGFHFSPAVSQPEFLELLVAAPQKWATQRWTAGSGYRLSRV